MELSKLSPPQQIVVGAAAAMLLISFLPWFGNSLISFSAWNSGLLAVLAVVLVVAAGVILVLEAMDRATIDSPAEWVFWLAVAGFGFAVIRIFGWGAPRKIGLLLGIIAAGVASWGAYQNRLDNS